MSKQTATEWLFKKLWEEPKDKLTWYAILKQAEEMHKEQTIDSYNQGFWISAEGWNGEYGIESFDNLSDEIGTEEYYRDTFKK